MKRRLILGLLACTLASFLIGCDNKEIKDLKSLGAVESESSVQSVKLSASDKESEIYAQVSSRTLLDLSSLDKVPNEDVGAVSAFIDSANGQVLGTSDSDVLDDKFVSYLLFEMEKTPYYWTVSDQQIRGMDSTSRSIVVDVTYKSNGSEKPVKRDSFIPKGSDNYSQLMSTRFDRWTAVLNAKFAKADDKQAEYPALLADFEKAYGDPNEILESQSDKTLAEYMKDDKTLDTYSCLQNSSNSGIGATMTVRYVLVPKYVMGVNLGLSCKHMYITDYQLDSDPTSGLTVNNDEGNDVINDNIDKLLHSYYTAIDEGNHDGLFKLVSNYQKWDKYIQDRLDTSYSKNRGYTISLFDVDGTKIRCGVTLNKSIRARGSEMTLPSYTERYLYTLELEGSSLKVVDETLLSSKLTGEPAINAQDAETKGFNSEMNLSNEDKRSIEKVISELGVVQLSNDYSSDAFGSTVDLSLANSDLSSIKTDLGKVQAKKKAVWLTSYLQGYSNYASVKTRELYQRDDGSLVEGVATVDLIYKGDKWVVYNYVLNSTNNLESTTFSSKNALCIVTPEKVEDFTSQVDTTTNTQTEQDQISSSEEAKVN